MLKRRSTQGSHNAIFTILCCIQITFSFGLSAHETLTPSSPRPVYFIRDNMIHSITSDNKIAQLGATRLSPPQSVSSSSAPILFDVTNTIARNKPMFLLGWPHSPPLSSDSDPEPFLGGNELYILRENGTSERISRNASCASFSPNETHLSYVQERGMNWETAIPTLVITDFIASASIEVEYVTRYAWISDSKTLALEKRLPIPELKPAEYPTNDTMDNRHPKLVLFNILTRKETVVFPDSYADEYLPMIPPGSQYCVFISSRPDEKAPKYTMFWKVRIDDSAYTAEPIPYLRTKTSIKVQLPPHHDWRNAMWSENARWLAFEKKAASNSRELFLLEFDASLNWTGTRALGLGSLLGFVGYDDLAVLSSEPSQEEAIKILNLDALE